LFERQVSVTVRNASEQTITAWGVRGSVTYETGEPEKIEMYTDGFATGFGRAHRTFEPGEAVTALCGLVLRDVPVKSINLAPTALVFADGSARGDAGIIQRVFDRRARDRRVL
jgi:diaminopimelate decarboxylase